MLHLTRIAFTACAIILALTVPSPAADDLTDDQKADLRKACRAAAGVCVNSCGLKYPNHKFGFNEGLLYSFCADDCAATRRRCLESIPARTTGSGSSGGGPVLDPGTGNPPSTTQPFKKTGPILSQ